MRKLGLGQLRWDTAKKLLQDTARTQQYFKGENGLFCNSAILEAVILMGMGKYWLCFRGRNPPLRGIPSRFTATGELIGLDEGKASSRTLWIGVFLGLYVTDIISW